MFEEALKMLHFFLDVLLTAQQWKWRANVFSNTKCFFNFAKSQVMNMQVNRNLWCKLKRLAVHGSIAVMYSFCWNNENFGETKKEDTWAAGELVAVVLIGTSQVVRANYSIWVFDAQCLRFTCNESSVNICVCACVCESNFFFRLAFKSSAKQQLNWPYHLSSG